jgi:plastocyanin
MWISGPTKISHRTSSIVSDDSVVRTTLGFVAVLALASGAQRVAAAAATVTIVIRDHAFVPRTVHVKAGQKIVWRNTDQDAHTVTSGANNVDDGRWKSSPPIPDGETFTLRLAHRGRYTYFCEPHQYEASMHGTIVIER